MSNPSGGEGGQAQTPSYPPPAQGVIDELRALLQNIYADFEVNRGRVKNIADRGRELADDDRVWSGGEEESREFLQALNGLEKKINQTLDLKRLKEEGLVRAVKL